MIICFKNNTCSTNIGYFTESPSIDTFKKTYPNAEIIYVFDKPEKNKTTPDEFRTYCSIYNFDVSDYRRPFLTETGEEEELIGFRPRNHKYPCIIWNKTKGRQMKATPEYIHKRFQETSLA